jgi:hypothetical protein
MIISEPGNTLIDILVIEWQNKPKQLPHGT